MTLHQHLFLQDPSGRSGSSCQCDPGTLMPWTRVGRGIYKEAASLMAGLTKDANCLSLSHLHLCVVSIREGPHADELRLIFLKEEELLNRNIKCI